MENIIFFDTETTSDGNRLLDIGACKENGSVFHSADRSKFVKYTEGTKFLAGHNILAHDLKYIKDALGISGNSYVFIDTLYLSPLLFPDKPYHHLLKDDKLQNNDLNNPVSDSKKAMELFRDELAQYQKLSDAMQRLYASLLANTPQFEGFFKYVGYRTSFFPVSLVMNVFRGKICENAPVDVLVKKYPVELAYCLALITANDKTSIIPPWVSTNYPEVNYVMHTLRNTPCGKCTYCRKSLDTKVKLKEYFNFDNFRTYDGEPLQEKAVQAAVQNKSLLAIFPTGGGKSLTFQLPALIAGEAEAGLTVVISPLQSLMKDQVDNLRKKGISGAVTINGLLDPIERKNAIETVESGIASILYISPESLRSNTITRLLQKRNVARFVVDEAHCFSAWGQEFRVDYMYIGDFIREYQTKKNLTRPIPVSCFTATAKPKVISDIKDYFKEKLNIEMEMYTTNATRTNLQYRVLFKENAEEKYNALRDIIREKNCPSIVYVSRTKRAVTLADRLTKDGFNALAFHGKMDSNDKVDVQNRFMTGEVNIIVATSAFGMGVDKSDVGLVVHFDISDSLENYVQEAGRAGRDENISAECYVLFNDEDLNDHFNLLKQTKLSISEINQVWSAIKRICKQRERCARTPLEIAREAGWSEGDNDLETKVKTAIAALENAGYVKRLNNVPHVYATSINARNAEDAGKIIDSSNVFDDKGKQLAHRIMQFLISRRSVAKAGNDDAESRVDYISDKLGALVEEVLSNVQSMRQIGLLSDAQEMSASFAKGRTPQYQLRRYLKLEEFVFEKLPENGGVSYKELNELAHQNGFKTTTTKDIITIINFWAVRGIIKKEKDTADRAKITRNYSENEQRKMFEHRSELCHFIVNELSERIDPKNNYCQFSLLGLMSAYNNRSDLFATDYTATLHDVETALFYLKQIDAVQLDGGFFVLYNAIQVKIEKSNANKRYKKEDYKRLDEYYQQRVQQIHIVGKYAHLMTKNYDEALAFVADYFQLDYVLFKKKYFAGEKITESITTKKYEKLFGNLSEMQRKIIDDSTSEHIVVAAGPGSGKTRVLVHKLASLLLMEDIKAEQLLMLTFSRAAATEFRERLVELIGSPAYYVEIKTFHSYAFDILGRIGSKEESNVIIRKATDSINNGEIESGRITKTVLVIDEAQDMDENSFALVQALLSKNEGMKIIAVGDDDQNIYEFRDSNSRYMQMLVTEHGATQYELIDNYRSGTIIVELANNFARSISNRMKSAPIKAISDKPGVVVSTHYASKNLEIPVLEQIRTTYKVGTCCVMTATNEEALRMTGLLKKNGFSAKLIQSNDGFRLSDLIEVRHFMQYLQTSDGSSEIDRDVIWPSAIQRVSEEFKGSECLPLLLEITRSFEKAQNRNWYYSDLEEFIFESKLEDFITTEAGTVFVSTIHKTKGREFDNVYLMLNNYQLRSDEEKHAVYVAITRAKNALYINYNTPDYDRFSAAGMQHKKDYINYPEPNEIILQLSHKGVWLDYFIGREGRVMRMMSGDKLKYSENGLNEYTLPTASPIAKLSSATRSQISDFKRRGYEVYDAKVRYIVSWHKQDEVEEHLILLPDLYLRKR